MSSLCSKPKSKGTVIHRTTSETLRLGDDILANPMRIVIPIATGSRKKNTASSPNTSFQITGVTRYDLGEDSADDLDESHTDDISRITDNETPSFSEDSRDTDDPQQILLNPPPSVLQNQHPVSITEEVSTETDSEKADQEEKIGRFRIIKVETTAPFSRGRWTCFDYSDLSDSSDSSYILCDNQKNIKSVGTPTTTAQLLEALNRNNSSDVNITSLTENNCQEINSDSGAITMSNKTNIFPSDIHSMNAVRFWKNNASFPLYRTVMPTTHIRLDSNIHQNSITNYRNTNQNEAKVILQQVLPLDSNDNTRTSVASNATIDTKIEYAMDVVKNHLTQAVRLEVEDLKIKINELAARISYLEYENGILRANVAPEVLENLNNTGKM